jgi:hypothetical protein
VTRNVRILIGVLVAAGAGFAYWHFLLAPKRLEAADLATKQQQAQAQIAQAQATLATYTKARSAYAGNYAKIVRLGKAVPADDDTRSLILELDASASRSGADFSAMQLSGGGASSAAPTGGAPTTDTAPVPPGAVKVGQAGFAQMPFQFNFKGNFDSLESLFGRIERFVSVKGDKIAVDGRLVRIESLQLSAAEEGFPYLSAVVNASTYVTSGQPGLNGASQAAPAGAATGTNPGETAAPPTSTTTEVAG